MAVAGTRMAMIAVPILIASWVAAVSPGVS
jgi:hypothetical protein